MYVRQSHTNLAYRVPTLPTYLGYLPRLTHYLMEIDTLAMHIYTALR